MNTFLHRILGKMYALKNVFKIALTVYFNNEFVKKRMIYLRQNNSHNMVPLYFIHRRSLGPVQLFWVKTHSVLSAVTSYNMWVSSFSVCVHWLTLSAIGLLSVCLCGCSIDSPGLYFTMTTVNKDGAQGSQWKHTAHLWEHWLCLTHATGVILLIIFGLCCCDLHTSLNLCRFL